MKHVCSRNASEQAALVAALWLLAPSWSGAASLHETPQLRRPTALVVAGEQLYVANRAGSISTIDRETGRVIHESAVGKQLDDLALRPDRRGLLAVDSAANRLLALTVAGDACHVAANLDVPGSPVSVRVAEDGSFCAVAALWARRIEIIDLAPSSPNAAAATSSVLQRRGKVELPFAPRLQWLAGDGSRLVVADNFAGRIAVIDPQEVRLLGVHAFDGHNIRGLAADADGKELLVAHQILNEAVPTTRDRVFWGTVMSNVVRSIPLADLLAGSSEPPTSAARGYDLARWSLHPLGRPGAASGDPAAVTVTRSGKTIIALAGVDEIAFRTAPLQPFLHRSVGRRPAAIALDAKERFAYIANQFDDAISVFDMQEGEIATTISLGPQPPLRDSDRGEIAFFDARYSLDGWYSCHSCHTDGHSNGLRNDNFSDDSFGAPKRVLSLLGVADTKPWAWNGSQDALREQIRKSITITMRDHEGLHASEENLAALVAYLETLAPPPALLEARDQVDEAAKERGRQVFAAQGCIECHRPPTYTTPAVYDVGIDDAVGRREYNPPSLRGVSQRETFFHDNRAASLEEVLGRHRHGSADELSPDDFSALLTFLRCL